MKAQYVPLDFAAQTWPRVEKFIASALSFGHGDYTLEQVKVLVCMGPWLLIVMVDDNNEIHGAATVTFFNYPNARVGYITTIGGRLIANQQVFKELCEILKSKGATKIQGMGRPAIVRLWNSKFGAKAISTLMELEI
jgi:hypothetical protein